MLQLAWMESPGKKCAAIYDAKKFPSNKNWVTIQNNIFDMLETDIEFYGK